MIIEAHSAHPHAALWGAGATSSSDGQFFRASGRAAGRSDVNLHYGSEPGTKFNTFEKPDTYPALKTHLGARINIDLIRDNWDELLRMAASMNERIVRPRLF